ncbi:hypothetical protein [Pseudomonas typographi]|uniref:Uncharacterized protein n=1 Tax=Pseudomonas typographi TaxID=2715964 RepID=A0ABR7Z7Z8_9PSED|nr:hypothetical protein [Pseudomonas typographi]MBD1551906.1 hypothetical protein [Pseudomonas typographi]MBD1589857.1 hypothetical protein [Pseudomonas typographi]MBD1601547.1 hypothetical protein [Pseudomonas typographi]
MNVSIEMNAGTSLDRAQRARLWRLAAAALGILLMLPGWGWGASYTVSLEYNPNTPTLPKVINRGPSSYCSRTHCADNVDSTLAVRYSRRVRIGGQDAREAFWLQSPEPHFVTLDSGTAQVTLVVSFVGVFNQLTTVDGQNADIHPLRGTLVGNCQRGWFVYLPTLLQELWTFSEPGRHAFCHVDTEGLPISYWRFDGYMIPAYAFELRSKTIAPGIYRGRATLSAGAIDPDFSMGDDATVIDRIWELNIEFRVQHELSVEFPGTTDTVPLLPPQRDMQGFEWGNGSKQAPALSARVPFNVSTTGPFRVSYACDTLAGPGQCALSTPTKPGLAPFDIGIEWVNPPPTDPNFPVDGRLDPAGRTWGYTAPAGQYSGAFNLVMSDSTPLYTARGKQWAGDVTFTFDAQL